MTSFHWRAFLLTMFAAAVLSCGTSNATNTASTSMTPNTSTTTTLHTASAAPETTAPTTLTVAPPPALVVNVYWGGTVSNPTGTPERLLAGGRVVETASPATAALEALLDGPNELEAEIGMFTSIPAETTLIDLTISDRLALVDLSAEFEQSSGSLDEFIRIGQVVFTLTQFEGVDAVSFRIDGTDRHTLGSHGIDVSNPLGRDDFESIRALILVERPYPGSSFQSGDAITGESNTFEANVEWVVTDADGRIIGEGVTIATDGSGTWGTYEVTGILDAETAGRGSLIVFDTSARDGSQINIVEFPIQLEGA